MSRYTEFVSLHQKDDIKEIALDASISDISSDISNRIKAEISGVDRSNIRSGVVFFCERIVHWALNNGIKIDKEHVDALIFLRMSVRSLGSKRSVTGAIFNICSDAEHRYYRYGGDMYRDSGVATAIIADMFWGAIDSVIDANVEKYHHFLLEYAYLTGAEGTIRSLLSIHRKNENIDFDK